MDVTPFPTTLWAIHPSSFYPVNNAPVQAMSSQILQENALGNCAKGFTKVCVDTSTVSHTVIEGDQVDQAAFQKPMLAGPGRLVVLYMKCDGTQDDLIHNLPQHQGQADRPVLPWILLPPLPLNGSHLPTFSIKYLSLFPILHHCFYCIE